MTHRRNCCCVRVFGFVLELVVDMCIAFHVKPTMAEGIGMPSSTEMAVAFSGDLSIACLSGHTSKCQTEVFS